MALPLIRSSLLSQFPGLVHGMSTAQSADLTHSDRFSVQVFTEDAGLSQEMLMVLDALGWEQDEVAAMVQEHTGIVRKAEGPGRYSGLDALHTNDVNLMLAVRTADCAPVLLYAPSVRAIAAVHAGWQGTAENITESTAQAMIEEYEVQPEEIYAWIGPCAHGCCYTIGEELIPRFEEAALRHAEDGSVRLDLGIANTLQLRACGIPSRNIEVESLCTLCRPGLLHSHRRDGELSGRMVSVIGMTNEDS